MRNSPYLDKVTRSYSEYEREKAMRKVYEARDDSNVVRVYWNSEWTEFEVRLIESASGLVISTYNCDDKEDAIGTANCMIGETNTTGESHD